MLKLWFVSMVVLGCAISGCTDAADDGGSATSMCGSVIPDVANPNGPVIRDECGDPVTSGCTVCVQSTDPGGNPANYLVYEGVGCICPAPLMHVDGGVGEAGPGLCDGAAAIPDVGDPNVSDVRNECGDPVTDRCTVCVQTVDSKGEALNYIVYLATGCACPAPRTEGS